MHGVGLIVRSSAAFTRQSSFPARVESTVAAALAYRGGTWDKLASVTITLDDSRYVKCGGIPNATR